MSVLLLIRKNKKGRRKEYAFISLPTVELYSKQLVTKQYVVSGALPHLGRLCPVLPRRGICSQATHPLSSLRPPRCAPAASPRLRLCLVSRLGRLGRFRWNTTCARGWRELHQDEAAVPSGGKGAVWPEQWTGGRASGEAGRLVGPDHGGSNHHV